MKLNSIWVYGVGGVGGYFGGKIALAATARGPSSRKVFFIARGHHLEEIRKRGLTLNTSDRMGMICKPERATENADELPAPDLCLICVKSYDLDDVVRKLTEKVKDETVLIPLLNGVDIYERIRNILRSDVVLPACVYVGTHIEEPGVVTQKGGDGTILCGADPEVPRLDYTPLIEFFHEAGISFAWRDDPYRAIWGKYIFIASFSVVTALFRKTLGEVFRDEALRELVRGTMSEVVLLAGRKGIYLPEEVVDSSLAKAGNFPFETKTSFQRDVETKGGRNEADLFGGTIIRTGEALGIETPITLSIYDRLQKAMGWMRALRFGAGNEALCMKATWYETGWEPSHTEPSQPCEGGREDRALESVYKKCQGEKVSTPTGTQVAGEIKVRESPERFCLLNSTLAWYSQGSCQGLL